MTLVRECVSQDLVRVHCCYFYEKKTFWLGGTSVVDRGERGMKRGEKKSIFFMTPTPPHLLCLHFVCCVKEVSNLISRQGIVGWGLSEVGKLIN